MSLRNFGDLLSLQMIIPCGGIGGGDKVNLADLIVFIEQSNNLGGKQAGYVCLFV